MSRLFLFASDERVGSSGAPAMSPGFRVSSLTGMVTRVTLVAATSTWLAFAAMPSARAEVVFGNLGVSGTQAPSTIGNLVTSSGTNPNTSRSLATAFVTPNSTLRNLQTISLGLANTSAVTTARRVSIHVDVGGVPSPIALATSEPTNVVGVNSALYTFTFMQSGTTGQILAPSTKYWIIPQNTPDYRWFVDQVPRETPGPLNGSGYTWGGAIRRSAANPTVWINDATTQYALSVSVIPVPESSTLPLAGVGLVIGGWVARRRSKQRPDRGSEDEGDDSEVGFSECDDRS